MFTHPDWGLLALVEIPVAKGFRFGTAYPVGPDLLLTSGHLLENRNHDEAIKICFVGTPPNDESGKWEDKTAQPFDVEVVWPGLDAAGEFDAALLRVKGLAVRIPFAPIANVSHGDAVDYVGRGFARAGKSNSGSTEMREPVPFAGRAMAPHRADFVFTVPEPKDPPNDWRGVSGAPVFVGARIVGVVKKTVARFPGQLRAVSTSALLQVQAFRDGLGWDDVNDLREQCVHKVRAVLDAAPAAVDAILETARLERTNSIAVSEMLVTLSLADLIETINKAHASVVKGQERPLRSAQVLLDVLMEAMPVVVDAQITEPFAGQQSWLIKLPISNPVLVEIAHAAAVGRRALFDLDHERDGCPMASGRIDLFALEEGIHNLGSAEVLARLTIELQRVLDVRGGLDLLIADLEHLKHGSPARPWVYLWLPSGSATEELMNVISTTFDDLLTTLVLDGRNAVEERRRYESPLRELLRSHRQLLRDDGVER